ncbi:MAG: hypothetical protein M1831_004385 [Alyxoria varia]|nr:MAG: hypothetical protein M1831_004385 [Alyxoria varia]
MVLLKSLAALPALSLLALASSVQDLTPKNFDQTIFKGTPGLVEFFAPWCGHCKKLAPVYDDLADSFKSASSKVTINKVDADAHKDLGSRFGIQGFPTIKWFDGKSKDPEDYNGGRDLESLQKFITEKTGVRPKGAVKAPSSVQKLNDQTFKGAVGGEKDVFVAFTAPWCGHCKTLAPIWEKLATDFEAEPNVTIAKVDAEANKVVAADQGVSSYPTIKFFTKGSSTSEAYNGGRDEQSLLTFVNGKAGTYRKVGGGLDTEAGLVPALDNIIVKVSGGKGDLASITDETKKAANTIQGKSAEYYLKVLEKLKANKDYVEKEAKRLEGLLEKGGLARPKEDDLTRRLNVLKSFIGQDGEKGEEEEEDKEAEKEL